MCAIVTREKQLHVQDLAGDKLTPHSTVEIKQYRVLNLTIDADDRIFALGTYAAHHRLLLLELIVSLSTPGAGSVREITHLPGLSYNDEVTLRVSNAAGERFALVAALVRPTRRAIYRVRLESATTSS